MSFPKWRRYLRFWGSDLDADLAEEFRFHLETEVEELVARGMSPADARADALRRFGDVAYYRDYCRRADARRAARERRGHSLDVLSQDLRYALRSLIKQPAFAIVAILTLGLGIGANTAIFSVVNGVVLSPLPYREPDRLVLIWESINGAPQIMVSYPDYVDWRSRSRVFEDIATYNGSDSFNSTGEGDPERIRGGLASGNLFQLLGVNAEIGRVITPADDRVDAPPVAVISHRLWVTRFSSNPNAVGRTMTLDGLPYTIIGVLPSSFTLTPSQLWLPIGRFTDSPRFFRNNHPGLLAIGRLKPGVTLDQMRRDLSSVMTQLAAEHSEDVGIGAGGDYLADIVVGPIKPALLLLSGAVGLVLLVACANVANLLLGRAAFRQREIGLRVAIGAARQRIVRQLLTESIVLAMLGGALGVALAWAGMKLLVALRPTNVPRLTSITMSTDVLVFAFAVSAITGILFGLVPAIQATRGDPIVALREGTRNASLGHGRARLRSALTVAEVGLALVLLVGAGLLFRSFVNLVSTDLGFDKRNVIVALVQLPEKRYADTLRRIATFEELATRVRALPGVSDAALTTDLPISSRWQTTVTREGEPRSATGTSPLLNAAAVSPGYFRTMRINVLSGREFSEASDRFGLPPVVIVSRAAAKRLFGTVDVLGKRLRQGPAKSDAPLATIVGIVRDVKNEGIQRSSAATVYFPSGQSSDLRSAWVVVRATTSADALGPALRKTVTSIDPELPLALLQTLDQTVDSTIAQPKFSLVMLSIFAGIALALAAIGIYGVISYNVAQRTREIGVRIALGAQRADVLRMVVRQGMALSALGVVLGGIGAAMSGKIIAKHLFGVEPSDPGVFSAVAATLLSIAFIASVVPARRATRIDPVEAMRRE